LLEEFYRAGIPQKDYQTIDELQADLDAWIGTYNHDRPHQSRWCYVANEKLLTTADMSDGSYRQQ
jgi:hypothetical protein